MYDAGLCGASPALQQSILRDDRLPKYGCFFGKVQKGGGVISDPKNYIADFVGFKELYFGRRFWKKCPKRGEGGGVISNPKNPIANLCKLTHGVKRPSAPTT